MKDKPIDKLLNAKFQVLLGLVFGAAIIAPCDWQCHGTLMLGHSQCSARSPTIHEDEDVGTPLHFSLSIMLHLFRRREQHQVYSPPRGPPPGWTPAPEASHTWGLKDEAPEDEFEGAERFCATYPVDPPRLLSSDIVDRINEAGCSAWGLEYPRTSRFAGQIQAGRKGGRGTVSVTTQPSCQDTCILSDLPLLAGLYDIHGKTGAYYEILIHRMDGIIAIGTVCRPYPAYRLPGWNRLSSGWHLDDLHKFFEDPMGGRDYTGTNTVTRISPGDTVGCGYEFASASIFFTYNGMRLPSAFAGVYLPRQNHDVFAAIGVEGTNEFEVNFGGDLFRWKEGNEWSWRVEGQVGQLGRSSRFEDEDLPSYGQAQGNSD